MVKVRHWFQCLCLLSHPLQGLGQLIHKVKKLPLWVVPLHRGGRGRAGGGWVVKGKGRVGSEREGEGLGRVEDALASTKWQSHIQQP